MTAPCPRRLIGTAVVFTLIQGWALSQLPLPVHKTVQSFLNSWLVHRDLEAAQAAFGSAALGNEAMLQASCAGYIPPQERTSEAARRSGIAKFLKDFLPAEPTAGLGGILDGDLAVESALQLGDRVVNDPKADGFVLAKIARNQLPIPPLEIEGDVPVGLPDEFYASFVPIGGGVVYFFWVREGQTWRILHASLMCM